MRFVANNCCWIVFATLTLPTFALAVQEEPWKSEFSDLLSGQDTPGPAFTLSGNFSVEKHTRSGVLNVILDIKDGWHGYSQRELAGQKPTRIAVAPGKQFRVVGPFSANQKPKAAKNELGKPVEELSGRVVWSAPIEIAENVRPKDIEIKATMSGQVCKQSCVPILGQAAVVVAKFSKYTESKNVVSSEHGTVTGVLSRSKLTAGDRASITISVNLAPDWHIYKLEPFKPDGTTPQPTIIYFTNSAGFKIANPVASSIPVEHPLGLPNEPFSYYHEDRVDWKIGIEALKDSKPGKHVLEGKMIFQLCTETNCDMPTAVAFSVPITIGDRSIEQDVPVSFRDEEADRDELMEQSKKFWAGEESRLVPVAPISLTKLLTVLGFAFLAGLILNAMPCVLPVIGLKVMSFVQQAGGSRGRVLMLNVVFSFGMLSVFWVLATLSTFFGYGWGDWLTKSLTGSIIITTVVFAFALSMLGVWEIPIPGLSGSTSFSRKSEQDGLLGAFFLGILTTVLATPCTGPLLIPAVTATIGQPPWVAYLIFTTIGLGMALPYLAVGVFPSLVSWLPRPGAWMTTFKQITGFILLATVVFLMGSFSTEPRNEYLIAMLTTLLLVGFGCWWIGRTSLAAETSEQMKAWGTSLGIVVVGTFAAFLYLGPAQYELDWQPYSKARLGELLDDNRLVFIDFTGPN